MAIVSTLGAAFPALPRDDFAARDKLVSHSEEFREGVIEVTEGVFTAVGYSASNVTLILGQSGSIVVDTSANPVDA
jgi:hypothetical protein